MRREGYIPAVIYGAAENKNIKVHQKTFRDMLNAKPSSQILLDLQIEDGDALRVFIQDIQFDALSGEILHADFMAVNDETVLTAKLPIKLLGEPKGVKTGGLLEQLVHTVKVKSLPKNLPLTITTKVDHLDVQESLTIGDIEFPEGVTPKLNERVLVALVAKTRAAQSEGSEGAVEAAAAPAGAGSEDKAETAEG